MIARIGRSAAGTLLLVMATPALALAHPLHGGGGFVEGFLHPFHGLDHILAMVAVGLLAWIRGGRSTVVIPAVFVTLAAAGWGLGFGGLAVPHVEALILASVIGLGVLVALGKSIHLALVLPLLAAFGLAHGFAHGSEIPGAAMSAGGGLIVITVLLYAGGVGAGALLASMGRKPVIRYAGGLVALAGGLLVLI